MRPHQHRMASNEVHHMTPSEATNSPEPMPEFLTTKELAALLRLTERKVYDLAASGEVPCYRATGKLLFSRDSINSWLQSHSSGPQPLAILPLPNVCLGSHDPLLDWALRESECGIATYFDGSADGLERFSRREGIATGLHIYDAENSDWNTPAIRRSCGGMSAIAIRWARRQRGLIVKNGSELAPATAIGALVGRRFVLRQPQSGAHSLFLHVLDQAGYRLDEFDLTSPVRSEVEAAVAVLEGKADVAFGLAVLATQFQLNFIPVVEETFDLVVDRRSWFEAPMQTFLKFCGSKAFAERADEFGGYDISVFGEVLFNGL